MNLLKYILLCFSIASYILCEEVEIIVESTPFTIDTVAPEIEIYSPSHGDVFGGGDIVIVTWDASDDSPAPSPMILNVSAYLDDPYMELASGFPNTGSLELDVPDFINTLFASVRLDITDYYGNMSSAYSDGYFTLGNPNEQIYDMINEATIVEATSEPFEIDTKPPEVSWIFPNQATSFLPLQGQVVRWEAIDETLSDNPIDLFFIDGGVDNYPLAENVINNGQKFIYLPDIQTSLGHFKVMTTDYYGNVSYDLSDEYMSIGTNDFNQIEDENITLELESEPFEIDTKSPVFSLINDNDYFYPNGGELLTDYSNINFGWNASDDSFNNGQVEVSLAYLLGGWYTSLGTFEASNPHSAFADLSIDGLVENTIWARLIYTAIDDYGNTYSQYSNDYFTLGSSDGNISADLFDEENIEMFISWTWENQKHRIKISPRAIEDFSPGDQIVIVGENSIQDTDCLTPTGISDLGFSEIEPMGMSEMNIVDRIVLNQGVNHCDYGGGALPGYSEGDSIRFKIIQTDTSYFIRPSDYRGSLVFDNGVTIIKEFNPLPYEFNRYNNNYDPLTENGRDWDSFNVYGKVTNHQGSSRSCDNDGVCDSSELLDSYSNEEDCTANSGIWNGTLCYYDFNNDGQYSPDEADENIADCFSDCCSQSGSGENQDWCFIETVDSEEYTHSLVQNNYLPINTSSATVNYRVWLVDDQSNEIYKTVDTEDYEIQIGTDDIPDYIKNLSPGWNWISLNVQNDDMSLNNIFANSTFLNADFIKNQTTPSQYYVPGDQWYPNWNMNLQDMYIMNINEETSILYSGSYPNPEDISISIAEGWTWIGYTPTTSLDVNTALASLEPENGDFIKNQTTPSQYYIPGDQWYPALTMEPTEGYMVNFSSSHTFSYPNIDSNSNENVSLLRLNNEPDFNYRQFKYNASVTIELDMPHLTVSNNDIIRAFLNDEERGMVIGDICPLNDKILFNLMIYSNNEIDEDLNFIYYNDNLGKEYKIRETLDFEKDAIVGNAYNPIVLTDLSIPLKYELESPYPNPFNPTTTIKFSLIDNQTNFKLNIYDIRGRLVETLYAGQIEYGYHTFKWNASSYSSGIYFVNMITDSKIFTKKITLLK